MRNGAAEEQEASTAVGSCRAEHSGRHGGRVVSSLLDRALQALDRAELTHAAHEISRSLAHSLGLPAAAKLAAHRISSSAAQTGYPDTQPPWYSCVSPLNREQMVWVFIPGVRARSEQGRSGGTAVNAM
jgi:hypothetical protein